MGSDGALSSAERVEEHFGGIHVARVDVEDALGILKADTIGTSQLNHVFLVLHQEAKHFVVTVFHCVIPYGLGSLDSHNDYHIAAYTKPL